MCKYMDIHIHVYFLRFNPVHHNADDTFLSSMLNRMTAPKTPDWYPVSPSAVGPSAPSQEIPYRDTAGLLATRQDTPVPSLAPVAVSQHSTIPTVVSPLATSPDTTGSLAANPTDTCPGDPDRHANSVNNAVWNDRIRLSSTCWRRLNMIAATLLDFQ